MNFILDSMLGKLAKLLRILGYSAEYRKDGIRKEELDALDGTVLTRKRGWKGQGNVVVLYEDNPYNQLVELYELGLVELSEDRMFTRCVECNGELEEVDREEVFGLVPEFVYQSYSRFARCRKCGKIYWEGSHTEHITENLRKLLGENG